MRKNVLITRGTRRGEQWHEAGGRCSKGVRSSALFTASCESLSPIACLDPVCSRLWSAIRFSEPVAQDGKCWHNSLLRCFIFVSMAASVTLSNSTRERALLTVCFSWNSNCHFSYICPIIPVETFLRERKSCTGNFMRVFWDWTVRLKWLNKC